ncbi:hypothetical protein OGZ02_00045 [Brachyspira hyodysenteriae]|nr:hypothetical protein [Brachyspira hyodysenteriae]MDA1467268.1 hypothetical protein [Brachyspira hyodysenteriae]
MSQEHQYSYRLERKNKKIRRRNSIRDVMNAIIRHKKAIQNIINEGLNKYVSLQNINIEIQDIERIVGSDPLAARDLSYRVGSDIHYLRNEALSRKRRRENNRRQKIKIKRLFWIISIKL